MKYAIIDGNKTEATKGAKGYCPSCDSELIAKCGEVNVNHWAHKGNRNCDPWWENETDWHRSWKNKFPIEWQEVVHKAESGEKHIADVKTENNWVLEFQHSYLRPAERSARNSFYSKLVWVVDGTRRKTDIKQFQQILEESTKVLEKPLILRVHFPDECRLLKEWHNFESLVFFDFQEVKVSMQSILWLLYPKMSSGETYLSHLSTEAFIELHNKNKFEDLVNNMIMPIHKEMTIEKQNRQKNINYAYSNMMFNPEQELAKMRRRQKMEKRF